MRPYFVKSCDGFLLGEYSVDDGVTDNVLEEAAEASAGPLVDLRVDALDATSACVSADRRLGGAEDGLKEGLATEVHSLVTGLAATKTSFALATAAVDPSSGCHCFSTIAF